MQTQVAFTYMFLDGCPSDFLVYGADDQWHTIAFLVVPTTPKPSDTPSYEREYERALALDPRFAQLGQLLSSRLPRKSLQKWSNGKYREQFVKAFSGLPAYVMPLLNALSFQERTLRDCEADLLAKYNKSRPPDLTIGFESYDDNGRTRFRHSFVNENGYHEITPLENQRPVLLLLAWAIYDQMIFYQRQALQAGCDGFHATIISDRLSGDSDSRLTTEAHLKNLLNPYGDWPIDWVPTRSKTSHVGEFIVDNMAGWLNECMATPNSPLADALFSIPWVEKMGGWKEIVATGGTLTLTPALGRLRERRL